jgi:hypothetical protein
MASMRRAALFYHLTARMQSNPLLRYTGLFPIIYGAILLDQ